MRATILIAAAALGIAGCNQDQVVENTANIDEAATAEGISSNDTTAIDAATGEDAAMAADVDYTVEEEDNVGGNTSDGDSDPSRTSPRRTVRERPAGNVSETANATADATTNAE